MSDSNFAPYIPGGPSTSPFDDLLSQDAHDFHVPLTPSVHVIGTPMEDILSWHGQQHYQDCAIRSQEFVLEQFTGRDFGEDNLVRESYLRGWSSADGGTPVANIGNILEEHGIHVTHFSHATTYDLANELALGHKVIVGVDAGGLWHPENIDGSIDHAIVVSGIDTSDPNNVKVLVNDPGSGEAKSYSMDQFLFACHGNAFTMVATQEPAPSHLPEMAHFDYAAGHIPSVMGLPYDQFTQMETHTSVFDSMLDTLHSVSADIVQDVGHAYEWLDNAVHLSPHGTDGQYVHPIQTTDLFGPHPDPIHLNDVHITDGVLPGHYHVDLSAEVNLHELAQIPASDPMSGDIHIHDMHITPSNLDDVYHVEIAADIDTTHHGF